MGSCGVDQPELVENAYSSLPDVIDYNIHVRPILSDRCFICHGPDKNKLEAGLRLDIESEAKGELPEHPGTYAIVAKNPGRSQLVSRILSEDEELLMPPGESKLSLSPREKAILLKWIEQGAIYKDHWAFIPPTVAEIPKVNDQKWPQNPIDYFVLNRLESEDLSPSSPADPQLLLRRVTLDLTGLPPTLEDMNSFLTDGSEGAYSRIVDRLLDSPHYGERMANEWMDLSRYADTHGYSVDRYRDMSPWRDWVIDAFNDNMSYEEFVTWQIGGDLLPEATIEQRLATGFNRNHSQNMEGGIVPEEFRVEYVSDRTNTFGKAFLGLTLECAKCHDHKYDPITQEDYYNMFSFFNNVNEAGQISWDNATPVPTLCLPDPEIDSITSFLSRSMVELQGNYDQKDLDNPAFRAWLDRSNGTDISPPKPVAQFDFESYSGDYFDDVIRDGPKAAYYNTVSRGVVPLETTAGHSGLGAPLNGDDAIDLGGAGAFERHEPFSVSIWVNVPQNLHDGVIFHKGIGAIIYNFRGFHLALKDDRLELMMAHTAPNNAIIEYATEPLPRDQWVHLAMTYDGSSEAGGIKVYINGEQSVTEVDVDNLYKNVFFGQTPEPGIKIGARWRGVGLKGAVVDDIMIFDKCLNELEVDLLTGGNHLGKLLVMERGNLTEEEMSAVYDYYRTNFDNNYQKYLKELARSREKHNEAAENRKEVMVMEEMAVPRQAHILERGEYNNPGKEVTMRTPAFLPDMDIDSSMDRLGLAKWLFSSRHPLTARVAVNRYWQMYFGKGLVETTEDFGSQGKLPSHPELLDYLAIWFEDSGWDVKALQKLIVTSATYRQSSKVIDSMRKRDPENELLARGPSLRLTGEMLRDNALSASGLMNDEIGGPSVRPYQPEGLWKMSGAKYETDSGSNLYRRGMYTIWKRTMPHPTLSTFDVPIRVNCEVRRQKTSTPLQALVMMNDPSFIEASRALALQMIDHANSREAIEYVFRVLSGRKPLEREINLLEELLISELDKFSEFPEKMDGWLQMGELDGNISKYGPELAAYSVVASTIMNSDAVIQKR